MATKRDASISDIFYYFAEHTTIASGRTVGRKIGVVQEILVKKLLHSSQRLVDGVVYEPRVPGRSGATHKVEFVFFQPLEAAVLRPSVPCHFQAVTGLSVTLQPMTGRRPRLLVSYANAAEKVTIEVDRLVPYTKGACERLYRDGFVLKTSAVTGDALRISLLDKRSPVCSIESKRVGAQRFSSTDKLGSGIQTIEKAKQASLVAIDFDLLFNKTLLALSDRTAARSYKSIVVLGNGVHWTTHDRAILRTYVDNTYLAADSAIIRYADYVRAKAEAAGRAFFEFFMGYFDGMTQTVSDDFIVRESDFPAIEPENAAGLLRTVEAQMRPFPTHA